MARFQKTIRWTLFPGLIFFTFFSGLAEAKNGGALTGHLKVTAPARKAPPSNQYAPKGSPPSPPHILPEEVVVYLKKVPGKYKAPKKHVALDQKYLQFTHRILPVLKGTKVDFTNQDPVYHNVFSNSQINKFDLGRKKNGETTSVKMGHSEVPVKVYCEIHSAMKSNILVLDNPFFTTAGPDQDFVIKGIPPGTYTLVAWHDFWMPVEETVTIKKGKTTQMNITLDKAQN